MRRIENSTAEPIVAVSFDVTHTLIHCPRLAETYHQVLKRHGIHAAPQDLRRVIPRVWQEVSCSADPWHDRFTRDGGGARDWWHRFLARVCRLLETAPPSRFASAELFHRFAEADVWEVYPDVIPALRGLAASGLRLGVVSNWDHRLPRVLEGLGLARYFHAVLYSSACGVEKPHPLIFESCLKELGVDASRAVHVGDHPVEDCEGAEAVGMRAVRIDRREPGIDLGRLLGPMLKPRPVFGGAGGGGRRARRS